MKVKLTQIVLAIYLVAVSILMKDYNLVPWLLFAASLLLSFFLGKNILFLSLENLIFVLIALSPFPYLLLLFLLYLPFAVFGMLFSERSFIKSYIFGFAVSLIPTILLYIGSNYLGFRLSFPIIISFFYLPALIALFIVVRNGRFPGAVALSFREYALILAILAPTLFVAMNIANDGSLFISNGTYYFSKFGLIAKSIASNGDFPIYDPSISAGESPFLFETPLMFSHIAFANIMLPFIPQLVFYNLYSFFILFISILSMALLLSAIANASHNAGHKRGDLWNTAIIALGSLIIGLHFYFVQFLESFKAFFVFPLHYLLFALVLEKPQNIKETAALGYLAVLAVTIHVAHGIGIVLLLVSLVFLMLLRGYCKDKQGIKAWLLNNKAMISMAAIILVLLPLFYVAPTVIFRDFLEDRPKTDWKNAPHAAYSYIRDFFAGESQISLSYPDVAKNDDKRFGPFISVLGLLSLVLIFLFYKSEGLANARLFAGAYLGHFLVSSIIINSQLVGSMEYSYRTATPYLLIVLVASICAIAVNIQQKYIKIFLVLLLLAGFAQMAPLAKRNIENIHQERIISGDVLSQEIDFIGNLPVDGRVITYGLYSNAIDPAMAFLTGRYFSRNLLTTNPRSRGVYAKIHGTNAFGQEDFVLNKSAAEVYNYLRIGGYKYIFADICHPAGAFIAQKLYPDFSAPLYQNQCLVFLGINGSNYAEKVSVLEEVDEEAYKTPEGYKYFALSPHFDFGEGMPYSKEASEPEPLEFRRIKPTEVSIYGNFENNDWVVFKEDYFGRWKAYMDGKEIPVFATNHNSILLRTIRGRLITLEYRVLPVERIIGALSFISALVILIALVIWLKPNSHLNRNC